MHLLLTGGVFFLLWSGTLAKIGHPRRQSPVQISELKCPGRLARLANQRHSSHCNLSSIQPDRHDSRTFSAHRSLAETSETADKAS
ncbi:hypothetical protein B0T25DRAFT_315466 [Lasiosphaeria hispida]|uniref:Secreted protein n=1 Tax=Lasiosphaeria hispida TaxID=260671 RepID=A0AAJ0H910_9PEZI|nr:hypothetical protein B0T25DRAFT_315466 [Lasiosphaeria hispida]